MKKVTKIFYYCVITLVFILSANIIAFARVGGAGGGSGSSGGGGGYSGPGSSSYDDYSGHSSGSVNDKYFLFFLIVIFVIVIYIKNKSKQEDAEKAREVAKPTLPFPPGLDKEKIAIAFMAIQQAWQNKDLTNVRKWLSDGMYQKLTVQFNMMNALQQTNLLDNIRINYIKVVNTNQDGHYQTADVAISFTINDSFVSATFPEFNEKYPDDSAVEYWTFIKRIDNTREANLYDNNNCPNCGAPLDIKMGEISRCSNCNTLTNSAIYDWVLCEITQSESYMKGITNEKNTDLEKAFVNDPFFATQRIEDIASNIFMQIMNVLAGADPKCLTRFANEKVIASVLERKSHMKDVVFDRLYLKDVSLTGYNTNNTSVENLANITVVVVAAYRRVHIGNNPTILDNDFVTASFRLQLSRDTNINPKKTETVFSYECSSCGAPYTDTTDANCSYCGALVVDTKSNWVLTGLTTL